MKAIRILRAGLGTFLAFAIALGATEASALTTRFQKLVPATSGAPFDPSGSTGQNFTSWFFTNNVTNNAATTRVWSVPINGITGTPSAISNVEIVGHCTVGSNASVLMHSLTGSLVFSAIGVPCAGLSSSTHLTGAEPYASVPLGHTIVVAYALAPGGVAGPTSHISFSP